MKEKLPYINFVKSIAFAIKQFRLYSQEHPIAKQALENLEKEIASFFEAEKQVTLGSMKGCLVVNGNMASDKEPACKDLAKDLDRLGVEGLVFDKSLEMGEMTDLLKTMSERVKSLQEKGGFKAVFEEKGFKNIRLSTGKFQLVEDGQVVGSEEVVEEGKAEGGGSGTKKSITSIADIIHQIRNDQEDASVSREPIRLDCEAVVEQLEKRPAEVVDAAMEDVENPVHLEVVIRKVVKSLVEGLVSYLAEQGKDITKALAKLSKEFEKSLRKAGVGEEFDQLSKKIPDLFEEEADELRIQMMVKAYEKNKDDPKPLQRLASKLFKQEDVRERLAPSVINELVAAGMAKEEAQKIFETIEVKAAKKKKKVTIDADELEELKRQAASGGGGEGGGEVDERMRITIEKLEKVEKEKKVIQDEKERVESVVHNLSEGVLVVDKQGQVVMMNPAAEKLLGVQREEKMGKHVADGIKEEHLVSMTKGDLSDKESDVAKNVEVISLNDETRKVLQSSSAVIENEDGKTVGMVSVLSDVTKQKEVEELKTKFVSNVSHELRTPLVAIQKSISVIMEEELGDVTEDQKKFLSIAHRNIDRLSRLINDLLDVHKLEAGHMMLTPKSFSMCEMAKHVLSTVEVWAKDKSVNLKTDFASNEILVEGDQDRLTQVVTNLVSNALKYSPENKDLTIDVKVVNEKGEEWVEVGVNDQGEGISDENKKKIFDKFVQVGSAPKSAGVASTGLGLTITKEIIDLHSGEIWVESEEGKGSRFAFKIPKKFQLNEKVQPYV